MKVIRYIPSSPFLLPDEPARKKALEIISEGHPNKEIEDGYSRLPQFVDSGDLLERVTCPECGKELDSEDWSILMDALFTDYGFESLDIDLPCCGTYSSLDKLIYDAPCGFSCFEVDVIEGESVPDGLLDKLAEAVGCPFKAIIAEM